MASLTKVLFVGCAILGAPLLSAETMDVKTGQWETTTLMQIKMPPIDTSKMSPEIRARIEQSLKDQQKPQVRKTCITQEMLNKGLNVGSESPNCKRTVVSSSRTVQDLKVECSSPRSSFTMHIEATSRETAKGTIKSTSSEGMAVNGTFTAKWLGPCPESK